MMKQLITILSSIEFWKIAAPGFLAIIAWGLNERSKRHWEKWQFKKLACLKALKLANAVLSNYDYPNIKKGDIQPQYEDIETARSCIDELACTCDKPDVLNELKKILFDRVTPASIVDLRNAVRRELKFAKIAIDTDKEKAFIGKLNCEKKET